MLGLQRAILGLQRAILGLQRAKPGPDSEGRHASPAVAEDAIILRRTNCLYGIKEE